MNFYMITCAAFVAAYIGYFLYWLKNLDFTKDFPWFGITEGNPLVTNKDKQLHLPKAIAIFAGVAAALSFGQLVAPQLWPSSRPTFQFFFLWPLAMVAFYRFYMIPRHIRRRAENRAMQLRAVVRILEMLPGELEIPMLVCKAAGGLRGRSGKAFANLFPWLFVEYSGDLVATAPAVAAKIREFVDGGAEFPA